MPDSEARSAFIRACDEEKDDCCPVPGRVGVVDVDEGDVLDCLTWALTQTTARGY